MRAHNLFLLASLVTASLAACTNGDLLPVSEPGVTTIDSAAWRERMSQRVGLSLTATMLTCGDDATCSFSPANYHCGQTKIGCTVQTAPITVAATGILPRTIVVSGRGALLCNETMGTVIAYDDAGDPVVSKTMVPIDPSDCAEDNITFGGTATVTWASGIDHIVIEPMSPFTFPVGGGTGIADATYTVQVNDVAIPFQVDCSATVVRAETVTCTAIPTDTSVNAAVVGWTFRATNGSFEYVRQVDTTNLSWAGQLVMPGWVEVTATVNDTVFPLPIRSNDIVVTARDWSQISSTKILDQRIPAALPTQPSTIEDQLGAGDVSLPRVPGSGLTSVTDHGPNHDAFYFASSPVEAQDSVRISAAMESGSGWYGLQELTDRLVNMGHGWKPFMCGRQRVVQMKPIIEAHEGLSWTNQPNSHAAQFFRLVDSVLRVDVERTVGTTFSTDSLVATVLAKATARSNFIVDSTSANNIVMGPPPDSLVSVGGAQCKFRFFPTQNPQPAPVP